MARTKRQETQVLNGIPFLIWRIALYIRESRPNNRRGATQDDSGSIKNQEEWLRDKIPKYFSGEVEDEGAEIIIVDVYIDKYKSGTTVEGRPEFQRMLHDVETGKINCIVTKNLSRAFRNSGNQSDFLQHTIVHKKIRFISFYSSEVDTYKDPKSARSLETFFTGFINENYAAQTSDNVREVFDFKRGQGRFIGAFAPYGYDKDPMDNDRLIIDDTAAIVVQDIFHWYVYKGMSKRGIAMLLNEKGIPNPTAYKRQCGLKYSNPHLQDNDGLWNATTVARILENPVYIGTMVQKRQEILSYRDHIRVTVPKDKWLIKAGTHAGIIDKSTFDTAQTLIKQNTKTSPGSKQLHLFSGLVKCADCGKGMARKVSKGIAYYACRTHTEKLQTRCTKHSIREDVLEKSVLAAIQMQVSLVEDMSEKVRKINESPTVKKESVLLRNLLAQKEDELMRHSTIMDALYPDLKNGLITQDEYVRLKSGYAEEIKRINESIDKLRKENLEAANGVANESSYLKGISENFV